MPTRHDRTTGTVLAGLDGGSLAQRDHRAHVPPLDLRVEAFGVIAPVQHQHGRAELRASMMSHSTGTSGISLSLAVSTFHASGRPVCVQTAA
jgi:hypothetical protein